jgi:hypothetical protein
MCNKLTYSRLCGRTTTRVRAAPPITRRGLPDSKPPATRPTLIIALNPYGRAAMTRDMELIREILVKIQNRDDAQLAPLSIEGYRPEVVARHLELLHDAGLLEALKSHGLSADFPIFAVKDLTWSGHDLASALANDSVWQSIKNTFSKKELAGLTFDALKAVAAGLALSWAKHKAGLS